MRSSLLPPGGENKFQLIKQQRVAAEAAGIKIIDLSVGEPAGGALQPLRTTAAAACLLDDRAIWRYQDNDCHPVPDFAQRFVECHTRTKFGASSKDVSFLPTPGIKSMLGVVINALGGWAGSNWPSVWTMTKPGYGTPADQARMAKNVNHFDLPMNPERGFLFSIAELEAEAQMMGGTLGEGDLIMLNIPHNPTGVVAPKWWLESICGYCEPKGIRLSNDNAYGILSHTENYTTLADVAVNFPKLNWVEGFSASKAGNNTGARIGAIVGSPEFVKDIANIKGNTDSGFVAPMALGVLELYENNMNMIHEVRDVYKSRLNLLIAIMEKNGMRLAVRPEAGFFVLCNCPKQAFGELVKGPGHFNELMIKHTGILGVHFAPNWIRYAVCATDVIQFGMQIREGFERANISYAAAETVAV